MCAPQTNAFGETSFMSIKRFDYVFSPPVSSILDPLLFLYYDLPTTGSPNTRSSNMASQAEEPSQKQPDGFVLDSTTSFAQSRTSPSFVFDTTTTCLNIIDEERADGNILEEDDEMFKLILLFSRNRPFLHQSPEPDSKKLIHELKPDLPLPSVFKRKKTSGLPGSTQQSRLDAERSIE